MSLSLALGNALSGLSASQQSLAIISQNIANANNADYSRQRAEQEAVTLGSQIGAGVRVTDIVRVVDERIARTVVNKIAGFEKLSIISDYYNQSQIYFGNPGANNSLDAYVSSFFNSVSNLSSTIATDRGSYRQDAVTRSINLATEISQLASNVQNLRFQADQELKTAVDNVNFQLKEVESLNRAIISADSLGQSKSTFQDQMDKAIKEIATYLDVQYRISDEGTYTLGTAGGLPLFEDGVRYELDYTATGAVADFINDATLTAINIYRVNPQGDLDSLPIGVLASEGQSSEVTNIAVGGKIKGLLDIRDDLFPKILDQLDNMAATLRDAVNKIHNNGIGYPPPTSLTGTRSVSPTATATWSGSVMIAVVDETGRAVTSPYTSGTGIGFEPLTLDLSAMDDGSGTGKPSYQSILDAINEHFGAPQNRTIVTDTNGDALLHDISLVSHTDSLSAGTGSFSFGIDVSNLTANDTDIRITNAVVTPTAGTASVTVPASFPTSYVTSTAGTAAELSGTSFTVDMTSATSGPYDVAITVEVQDHNGGTVTATIHYQIADAASALRNDKYHVTSSTGNAAVETPSTNESFMHASLVDADGIEVAYDPVTNDYTESGYLKIETLDSSYRIAISELDSSERGSGRGFSHFFGLNDLFVDDYVGATGAAINMAVRSDIVTDPSRFSTGQLTKLSDTDTLTKYTYQVSNASAGAAQALADLGLTAQSFEAAGELPNVSLTFSDYVAEIIGYSASKTADAEERARQEDLIKQGFVDRNQSIRGVNLDEELGNVIIFQNTYAANARVITVTKDLFEALLGAFQ